MTRERRFTIREAAALTGMPASTLRYYEAIGIIQPIARETSGHRTYTQADVDLIDGIACLIATGMPIPEMRAYLEHRLDGADGAAQEMELLENQQRILAEEAQRIRDRQEYVRAKIAYWQAVAAGDGDAAEAAIQESRRAALAMREAELVSAP